MTTSSRGPDPSESLEAITAQIADLRGRVLAVQARVEHAGMKTNLKLADRVTQLGDQVARLTQMIDAADGPAPAVTAPAWHDLDADQHAADVEDLRGWVDGFLAPNYPHTPLRPCWADHPAALWELSTLRAEWTRVYDRRSPDLAGALNWHDRYLPGVITRLSTILKDCKGSCGLVRSPVALRRPRAG